MVPIVITGSGTMESTIEAIHLEVGGYIQKPLSMKAVLEALEKAIEKRSQVQQRLEERLKSLMNFVGKNAVPDGRCLAPHMDGVEFVPMLIHQIRNPLTAIIRSAELALIDLDDETALRTHLKNILAATEKIRQINTEFMKAGKTGVDRLADVNLRQVIESGLDMFQDMISLKGIRLRRELEAADRPVWGNRFELEQVFKNLILNAVQAMEGSGEKTLRAVAQADPDSSGENPQIRVSIEDSGCGIRKEDQERIFEPYFTRKPEGTGIGLPIVKQILQGMGGSIAVNSKPGKETAFTVSLPLSA